MKTELLIESNPNIRVFPQYAFLDAIINNSNTNIDKICSIYISGNTCFNWKYQSLNAEVVVTSEGINIYRKMHGVKPSGGFYCECKDFEEIVFNIQYMQYTNIWDKITFFYDTEDSVLFSDDDFCNYEFSIHCCGDWRVDVKGKNVYYRINRYDSGFPKWYKIRKHKDEMQLYYSFEGRKWVGINKSITLDLQGEKTKVGFHIHLYENQYQKWVCNNFIQIKFDKNGSKPIDYIGLMNRDWKNYSINPLVKFSYDKQDVIKQRGLWNYIVENICSGRYLEIWLNEYYIEGLKAFHKYKFIHESLIYGFNEKDKKISLMSFKEGKPVLITAPMDTIELAWENAYDNNHIIQSFEFFPDGNGYNVDIEHICKLLRDYLDGRNSSHDFRYIAQEDRGIFGHKIYDEILNDNNNKKIFLEDMRIAFLFKEHKECMLLRIKFLYEYGALSEEEYPYLMEEMDIIVKKADLILNLVIKNSFKCTDRIQDRIWNYISDLCESEEKCYQVIIRELEKYLRQ